MLKYMKAKKEVQSNMTQQLTNTFNEALDGSDTVSYNRII